MVKLLQHMALIALLCACNDPAPPAAEEPSPQAQVNAPLGMPIPRDLPPEQLPDRVVQHLEAFDFLGKPLLDHCELLGEDLNAYLDLYAHEIQAAAEVPLTDAQRLAIQDAYIRAGTVAGRCLRDKEVLRVNKRLLNLTQPLLPKKG